MLKRSLFTLLLATHVITSIFANDSVNSELMLQDISLEKPSQDPIKLQLFPFLEKIEPQSDQENNQKKSWVKYLAYLAPGGLAQNPYYNTHAHACPAKNIEHQGPSLGKIIMSGLAAYNIIQGLSELASQSPCVGACARSATNYLFVGAFQSILASLML